jgi:hypothetical protein
VTDPGTGPVRRSIEVAAPLERAFVVFTDGIGAWWPPDQHVGETPAEARMEPRLGGRCLARAADGTETVWGHVVGWEAPHLVRFSWQLTPDWDYEPDPDRCSEVEVTFAATAPGRTRVTLEHRGFERYGERGGEMRGHVGGPGGWGGMLAHYRSGVLAGP